MNETLVTNTDYYFGKIDYMVFCLMLSASTAVGVYFGFFNQSSKSTEEYLLGGRQMKTLPIAISLIASQLSGISIMAIPAEIYTFGIQYWIVVPCMIIIVSIINYLFIPIFYNNHLSNCYEYLELRFSKTVREIITANFLLNAYLTLPVISFLPALAFSQVTGLNIHLINTIVCCVCMFYTMLGGIKAVVWTDVIQATIMLCSCILVLTLGIMKVGSITEVWNRAYSGDRLQLFNMQMDLTTRQTLWNMIFGNIVLWTTYVGLNQSCVQRIVSVPSVKHAQRALWYFLIGVMIIMSLNCFTGVVMYARYYQCDPITAKLVGKPDKLMPFFVQDVVSHVVGMPGVFISCVFSAALSTMSASLNSLAGLIYENYIHPMKCFKHTEVKANLTMKTLVVMTGIYCILMGFVVENFDYILQMVMTFAGISQGAVLGVFTVGMLWPRANKNGALWGAILSVLITGWIVIGSQYVKIRDNLSYPSLKTSTEGCVDLGYNVTHLIQNEASYTGNIVYNSDVFLLYKISFPWFTVIGALIVWIVALPISHFTGSADFSHLNSRLIATFAHSLIPKEIRKAELSLKEITKSKTNNKDEQTEWNYQSNTKIEDK